MAGREIDVGWRERTVRAWLPDPVGALDLTLSPDTVTLVRRAGAAAVRAGEYLPPNWEPSARLLLRSEGVASSFVEGLRTPLVEVAVAELDDRIVSPTAAWVADNLVVVRQAVDEARTGELTVERLQAWHARLMEHSRLPDEGRGAFRTELGWVGGSSPRDAAYVAPPPEAVPALVGELVDFANRTDLDPVTQAAVVHAQFEMIHPYGDGNGRLGRVLIGWVLVRRTPMRVPPPVSVRIARDAGGYLSGLYLFRSGPVDQWVNWFAGVLEGAAGRTIVLAERLRTSMHGWREVLHDLRSDAAAHALVEVLPESPVLSVAWAAERLGVSKPAARSAVAALVDRDLLRPLAVDRVTRGRPPHWFVCDAVIDLVSRMTD